MPTIATPKSRYRNYVAVENDLNRGVEVFDFKATLEIGMIFRAAMRARLYQAGILFKEEKSFGLSYFILTIKTAYQARTYVSISRSIDLLIAGEAADVLLEDEKKLARKNIFRKMTFRKPLRTKFTGLSRDELIALAMTK